MHNYCAKQNLLFQIFYTIEVEMKKLHSTNFLSFNIIFYECLKNVSKAKRAEGNSKFIDSIRPSAMSLVSLVCQKNLERL